MQFADPNEYMLDIIAHETDTRLEQRRARLCFEPPCQARLVLLQRVLKPREERDLLVLSHYVSLEGSSRLPELPSLLQSD